MAVAGLEAVVIAVILVVFLFAGPKKIPELARAIGKAKAEFQTASRKTTGWSSRSLKKTNSCKFNNRPEISQTAA